jgi:hypothetical protein
MTSKPITFDRFTYLVLLILVFLFGTWLLQQLLYASFLQISDRVWVPAQAFSISSTFIANIIFATTIYILINKIQIRFPIAILSACIPWAGAIFSIMALYAIIFDNERRG